MLKPSPFKSLAVFLSFLVFTTNGVLAYAPETNFWRQRQKKIEVASLPTLPTLTHTIHPQTTHRRTQKWLKLDQPDEDLKKIIETLPASYGSIRDITTPEGKADGPIVIHIQDIHMNEEAQGNIRATVQNLIDQNDVGLVALEGAFGRIDLSRFRTSPYLDYVQTMADFLFREKKISGPIHAAFMSETKIPPFIGIDDRQHYKANVEAYRQSRTYKADLSLILEKMRRDLSNKKALSFHPLLKQFDDRVLSFRSGDLSLGRYIPFLLKHVDGSIKTKATAQFMEAFKLESELDFARVKAEQSELIKKVVQRSGEEKSNRLIDMAVAFRTGRISSEAFYEHLTILCESKGISIAAFPTLKQYIRYINLAQNVDGGDLFHEVEHLENVVYEKLTKTPIEKQLVTRSKHHHLTSKLIDFSLTPAEWTQYKKMAPNELSVQPALPHLDVFESFYREAEIRDAAMVQNLSRAIEENKAKVIILVTGGFHTPGMKRLMQQENFASVTFLPKLTKVKTKEGSLYLNAFTQEKTPIEKLVYGEKLFTAPHPARTAQLAPGAALLWGAKNPGVSPQGVLSWFAPGAALSISPVVFADGVASAQLTSLKTGEAVQARMSLVNGVVDQFTSVSARSSQNLFLWEQTSEGYGNLLLIIPLLIIGALIFLWFSWRNSFNRRSKTIGSLNDLKGKLSTALASMGVTEDETNRWTGPDWLVTPGNDSPADWIREINNLHPHDYKKRLEAREPTDLGWRLLWLVHNLFDHAEYQKIKALFQQLGLIVLDEKIDEYFHIRGNWFVSSTKNDKSKAQSNPGDLTEMLRSNYGIDGNIETDHMRGALGGKGAVRIKVDGDPKFVLKRANPSLLKALFIVDFHRFVYEGLEGQGLHIIPKVVEKKRNLPDNWTHLSDTEEKILQDRPRSGEERELMKRFLVRLGDSYFYLEGFKNGGTPMETPDLTENHWKAMGRLQASLHNLIPEAGEHQFLGEKNELPNTAIASLSDDIERYKKWLTLSRRLGLPQSPTDRYAEDNQSAIDTLIRSFNQELDIAAYEEVKLAAVHADLAPRGNILWDGDRVAVLTDFGSARQYLLEDFKNTLVGGPTRVFKRSNLVAFLEEYQRNAKRPLSEKQLHAIPEMIRGAFLWRMSVWLFVSRTKGNRDNLDNYRALSEEAIKDFLLDFPEGNEGKDGWWKSKTESLRVDSATDLISWPVILVLSFLFISWFTPGLDLTGSILLLLISFAFSVFFHELGHVIERLVRKQPITLSLKRKGSFLNAGRLSVENSPGYAGLIANVGLGLFSLLLFGLNLNSGVALFSLIFSVTNLLMAATQITDWKDTIRHFRRSSNVDFIREFNENVTQLNNLSNSDFQRLETLLNNHDLQIDQWTDAAIGHFFSSYFDYLSASGSTTNNSENAPINNYLRTYWQENQTSHSVRMYIFAVKTLTEKFRSQSFVWRSAMSPFMTTGQYPKIYQSYPVELDGQTFNNLSDVLNFIEDSRFQLAKSLADHARKLGPRDAVPYLKNKISYLTKLLDLAFLDQDGSITGPDYKSLESFSVWVDSVNNDAIYNGLKSYFPKGKIGKAFKKVFLPTPAPREDLTRDLIPLSVDEEMPAKGFLEYLFDGVNVRSVQSFSTLPNGTPLMNGYEIKRVDLPLPSSNGFPTNGIVEIQRYFKTRAFFNGFASGYDNGISFDSSDWQTTPTTLDFLYSPEGYLIGIFDPRFFEANDRPARNSHFIDLSELYFSLPRLTRLKATISNFSNLHKDTFSRIARDRRQVNLYQYDRPEGTGGAFDYNRQVGRIYYVSFDENDVREVIPLAESEESISAIKKDLDAGPVTAGLLPIYPFVYTQFDYRFSEADRNYYDHVFERKPRQFLFTKGTNSRSLVVGAGLDAVITAYKTGGEIWISDINPLSLEFVERSIRSMDLKNRVVPFVANNIGDPEGNPHFRVSDNGDPILSTDQGTIVEFDNVLWNMPAEINGGVKWRQEGRALVSNWDHVSSDVLNIYIKTLPKILKKPNAQDNEKAGQSLIWNPTRNLPDVYQPILSRFHTLSNRALSTERSGDDVFISRHNDSASDLISWPVILAFSFLSVSWFMPGLDLTVSILLHLIIFSISILFHELGHVIERLAHKQPVNLTLKRQEGFLNAGRLSVEDSPGYAGLIASVSLGLFSLLLFGLNLNSGLAPFFFVFAVTNLLMAATQITDWKDVIRDFRRILAARGLSANDQTIIRLLRASDMKDEVDWDRFTPSLVLPEVKRFGEGNPKAQVENLNYSIGILRLLWQRNASVLSRGAIERKFEEIDRFIQAVAKRSYEGQKLSDHLANLEREITLEERASMDRLIDASRRATGQEGPLRLLDVGTGPGRHLIYLNQKEGVIADGVEIAAPFLGILSQLKKEGRINDFFPGDMAHLDGIPDAQYDVVRAQASLLHSLNAAGKVGAARILKEVHRVLRPGGVFFVLLKVGEGLSVDRKGERIFQGYTRESLGRLLGEVGFKVLESNVKHDNRPEVSDPWAWALSQKLPVKQAVSDEADLRTHPYMPLAWAVANLYSGKRILSSEGVTKLSAEVDSRIDHLSNDYLQFGNPFHVEEEWRSKYFGGDKIPLPIRALQRFRWLDVTDAPEGEALENTNLMEKTLAHLLPNKEFQFDVADTSLSSSGQYDFISMGMPLHRLAKEGELLQSRPLSENYEWVDQWNNPINSPVYALTETQQQSIERLLSRLDEAGGVFFLRLDEGVVRDGTMYSEGQRNAGQYLIIRRKGEKRLIIEKQTVPFQLGPAPYRSREFLLEGRKDSLHYKNPGLVSLLPRGSEMTAEQLGRWLDRVDLMVFRHQSRDNSVWGQLEKAVKAINEGRDVVDVFSDYMSNVPSYNDDKKKLLEGLKKDLEKRSSESAETVSLQVPLVAQIRNDKSVISVALNSDGSKLLLGTSGSAGEVIPAASSAKVDTVDLKNRIVTTFAGEGLSDISTLGFSSNEGKIVIGHGYGNLEVRNANDASVDRQSKSSSDSSALSTDGSGMIVTTINEIQLVDPDTNGIQGRIPDKPGKFEDFILSPNKRFVAGTTWRDDFSGDMRRETEYTLKIGDFENPGPRREWRFRNEKDNDGIASGAFDPTGRRFAFTSYAGTFRILDVETGEMLMEQRPEGKVYRVSFSPDGRLLVTGNSDGTIQIYNAETGVFIGDLTTYRENDQLIAHPRHSGEADALNFLPIVSVSFSNDGQTLAAARSQNTYVWDISGLYKQLSNEPGSKGENDLPFEDKDKPKSRSSSIWPVNIFDRGRFGDKETKSMGRDALPILDVSLENSRQSPDETPVSLVLTLPSTYEFWGRINSKLGEGGSLQWVTNIFIAFWFEHVRPLLGSVTFFNSHKNKTWFQFVLRFLGVIAMVGGATYFGIISPLLASSSIHPAIILLSVIVGLIAHLLLGRENPLDANLVVFFGLMMGTLVSLNQVPLSLVLAAAMNAVLAVMAIHFIYNLLFFWIAPLTTNSEPPSYLADQIPDLLKEPINIEVTEWRNMERLENLQQWFMRISKPSPNFELHYAITGLRQMVLIRKLIKTEVPDSEVAYRMKFWADRFQAEADEIFRYYSSPDVRQPIARLEFAATEVRMYQRWFNDEPYDDLAQEYRERLEVMKKDRKAAKRKFLNHLSKFNGRPPYRNMKTERGTNESYWDVYHNLYPAYEYDILLLPTPSYFDESSRWLNRLNKKARRSGKDNSNLSANHLRKNVIDSAAETFERGMAVYSIRNQTDLSRFLDMAEKQDTRLIERLARLFEELGEVLSGQIRDQRKRSGKSKSDSISLVDHPSLISPHVPFEVPIFSSISDWGQDEIQSDPLKRGVVELLGRHKKRTTYDVSKDRSPMPNDRKALKLLAFMSLRNDIIEIGREGGFQDLESMADKANFLVTLDQMLLAAPNHPAIGTISDSPMPLNQKLTLFWAGLTPGIVESLDDSFLIFWTERMATIFRPSDEQMESEREKVKKTHPFFIEIAKFFEVDSAKMMADPGEFLVDAWEAYRGAPNTPANELLAKNKKKALSTLWHLPGIPVRTESAPDFARANLLIGIFRTVSYREFNRTKAPGNVSPAENDLIEIGMTKLELEVAVSKARVSGSYSLANRTLYRISKLVKAQNEDKSGALTKDTSVLRALKIISFIRSLSPIQFETQSWMVSILVKIIELPQFFAPVRFVATHPERSSKKFLAWGVAFVWAVMLLSLYLLSGFVKFHSVEALLLTSAATLVISNISAHEIWNRMIGENPPDLKQVEEIIELVRLQELAARAKMSSNRDEKIRALEILLQSKNPNLGLNDVRDISAVSRQINRRLSDILMKNPTLSSFVAEEVGLTKGRSLSDFARALVTSIRSEEDLVPLKSAQLTGTPNFYFFESSRDIRSWWRFLRILTRRDKPSIVLMPSKNRVVDVFARLNRRVQIVTDPDLFQSHPDRPGFYRVDLHAFSTHPSIEPILQQHQFDVRFFRSPLIELDPSHSSLDPRLRRAAALARIINTLLSVGQPGAIAGMKDVIRILRAVQEAA